MYKRSVKYNLQSSLIQRFELPQVHVFMVYSYAISSLVLFPLSFIFHRKTTLPPFSVGLLSRFFVLGLLGFLTQYLGYNGIDYSNPTLDYAMSNLTPATTFVLGTLPSSSGLFFFL
ncbi:WAT1-related protein [Abeliophyllum distichum]|uniref:WAT1-related protein n=1 Tax=Abeliophyllum distichum TaxID=126358 RepID=A0ABD1SH17_9LAMI